MNEELKPTGGYNAEIIQGEFVSIYGENLVGKTLALSPGTYIVSRPIFLQPNQVIISGCGFRENLSVKQSIDDDGEQNRIS